MELDVQFSCTHDQMADILTKLLPSPWLKLLNDKLCVSWSHLYVDAVKPKSPLFHTTPNFSNFYLPNMLFVMPQILGDNNNN